MQFRLPAVLVALVSIAAVSCSREPGAADGGAATAVSPPAWTLRVESVPAPTGPATMVPRLTASDGGVILSWVRCATRRGGGAPIRGAHAGSGWRQPDHGRIGRQVVPELRRPAGGDAAGLTARCSPSWLLSTNPSTRFRPAGVVLAGQRQDMDAGSRSCRTTTAPIRRARSRHSSSCRKRGWA